MFGKRGARIAAPSAAAVVAAAALISAASPAQAQVAIGPHQYFRGLVFGKTKPSVIAVACAGPETTGHPVSGQSVEVKLMVPSGSGGYTGNHADQINASLIWSNGPVTVVTPIATFTTYSVKMPIPTKIKVLCNGSGVMKFTPTPDPDKSAIPATVDVTFTSTGV